MLTGTENPELAVNVAIVQENPDPVPPMLVAKQVRSCPAAYPTPEVVILTVVTMLPATVIVASAPLPVPPISDTPVYVPLV